MYKDTQNSEKNLVNMYPLEEGDDKFGNQIRWYAKVQ
jgi:hypothetical protein